MSAVTLQDNEVYLSAKTIKERYDLPNSTFYDLRDKGKIPMPCYPFGDSLPRYKESELLALMEKKS